MKLEEARLLLAEEETKWDNAHEQDQTIPGAEFAAPVHYLKTIVQTLESIEKWPTVFRGKPAPESLISAVEFFSYLYENNRYVTN